MTCTLGQNFVKGSNLIEQGYQNVEKLKMNSERSNSLEGIKVLI